MGVPSTHEVVYVMLMFVNIKSTFRLFAASLSLWPIIYIALYTLSGMGADVLGYPIAFIGASIGVLGTAMMVVPNRESGRIGLGHVSVAMALCVLGLQLESNFTGTMLILGLGSMYLGTYLGGLFGRRVHHPHYVWPLVIVVVGSAIVTMLDASAVASGLTPERPPKALHSPIWIHVPIAGVGIDGIFSIVEPVMVGFCIGLLYGSGVSIRRGILGLIIGFVVCLAVRLTIQYPIPALAFFAPVMAISLGKSVAPKYRDLALSIGVVFLVWIVGRYLG